MSLYLQRQTCGRWEYCSIHCESLKLIVCYVHNITVLLSRLGGSSPFLVDSLDLTKDNIVNVRFSFPVKSFREVSEGAKQLCSQLMVREKR